MPAYAAAKAGLVHLTHTLAMELGRYGITVNAIAPGYFETDLNRAFLAQRGRPGAGQAHPPAAAAAQPADLDGALLLLVLRCRRLHHRRRPARSMAAMR